MANSASLPEKKHPPKYASLAVAAAYFLAGCIAVVMAGTMPAPAPVQLKALNLVSALAFGSVALRIPIGAKFAALPVRLAIKAGFVLVVSALTFPAPTVVGPFVRAAFTNAGSRQGSSELYQAPLAPHKVASAVHQQPGASRQGQPVAQQAAFCGTFDARMIAERLDAAHAGANFAAQAVSRNAGRKVTVSADGSLEAVNTVTHASLWSYKAKSRPLYVGFGPSGAVIVSVQADGSVLALDAATGRPLWNDETGSARVPRVSPIVSPDGSAVVIPLAGGRLANLITSDGKVRWEFRTNSAVRYIAFSPDGTRVLSVQTDGGLQVLDGKTGELVWEAVPSSPAEYGIFSPDGELVAARLKNGTTLAWTADGVPCKH